MEDRSLTPEEVQCEERRFEALIRRTRITGSSPRRPPSMPVSVLFAPFFGCTINGLALTNQWYRKGPVEISESHLAFVLARLRSLHIDISSEPVVKAGILREDLNSVYVHSTDPRAFTLFIETNPSAGERTTLEINNFDFQSHGLRTSGSVSAGGFVEDGIIGKGLDPQAHDCYLMAELLPRLIRMQVWNGNVENPFYYDTIGALFRDCEPFTYRLLAHPIDPRSHQDLGRLVARFEVTVDRESNALGQIRMTIVQENSGDSLAVSDTQASVSVLLVPLDHGVPMS
jgi:hypothetical protein